VRSIQLVRIDIAGRHWADCIEPAILGRIVRGRDDDPVRPAALRSPIVGEIACEISGVGGVTTCHVGIVVTSLAASNFDGAGKGRFDRACVSMPTNKAHRYCFGGGKGISPGCGQNMRFVERGIEGRTAMTRRGEATRCSGRRIGFC